MILRSDLAYQQIYSSAKTSIFVIDNYIGLKTLALLKSVPVGVNVIMMSQDFFLDDIYKIIVSKSVTDVTMQQKR